MEKEICNIFKKINITSYDYYSTLFREQSQCVLSYRDNKRWWLHCWWCSVYIRDKQCGCQIYLWFLWKKEWIYTGCPIHLLFRTWPLSTTVNSSARCHIFVFVIYLYLPKNYLPINLEGPRIMLSDSLLNRPLIFLYDLSCISMHDRSI